MNNIIITSLVVVRNEEDYIGLCLDSLIKQNFDQDKYEIIIIDGCSTDNTLSIIDEKIKKYRGKTKISVLKNEKKLLASGWNLGIKKAKGKYVVRIDAHAEASKNFLKNSLMTIEKMPKDVACVGGRLESVSLEGGDKTINKVLSSPFGIGNSKFRYADTPQYVDTVAFGLYKKKVFDEVGYFDETLERNQDNNMHSRIRNAGYKFYFNPKIKSKYYVRNTLKKMMKQGFLNGKWNIIVFRQNKKSISIRHIIPLLFVLSIIGLTILSIINRIFLYLFIAEICAYIVCGLVFSIKKTKSIIEIFKMQIYFLLLHISYGVGSLMAIFYRRRK